jgi:CRP-like cAMP-binding protein
MELLNLFGSLLAEDTKWLKENGKELIINTDETLITYDKNQTHLFFVMKGVFKVLADSKSILPIAILGQGEILGESALTERENSNATVKAVEKSLLLQVNKNVIKKYIEENPGFGLRLYKGLYEITVERLRNTNRQLTESYV